MSDQELLEQYLQRKDSSWLGVLLERYTLLLFGVCMKYLKNEAEAQDAVQQVFLKVIQEVHKYRIDYFKSWLYTVARNHCLSQLRDRKGKMPLELNGTEQPEAEVPEPEETSIDPQILQDALNSLNEDQRKSVTMFYLQKMSYMEISKKEGYSLLQVKSFIQNGKRNLKLFIQKMVKESKKSND